MDKDNGLIISHLPCGHWAWAWLWGDQEHIDDYHHTSLLCCYQAAAKWAMLYGPPDMMRQVCGVTHDISLH